MSDVDEKVARINALLDERLKEFVGVHNDTTMREQLKLVVRDLIAEQDPAPADEFKIDVQMDGDIANIVPLNWYSAILMFSARVCYLVTPTARQLREAEETGKFEWDGFTLTRTDDGWDLTLPLPADHLDVGDMSL